MKRPRKKLIRPRKKKMEAIKEQAPEQKPVEPPPKRIRNWPDWILPSIDQLIKIAPENETVRALVLAICKEPIPPDKVDYESIKQWFECSNTIRSNSLNHAAVTNGQQRDRGNPATAAQAAAASRVLAQRVEVYTKESGRCNYSVEKSGSRVYSLTEQEVIDLSVASGSMQALVDSVATALKQKAEDNPPDMNPSEDGYDVEGCDCDSCDTEMDIERQELTSRIRDFLSRYARAEYERLS